MLTDRGTGYQPVKKKFHALIAHATLALLALLMFLAMLGKQDITTSHEGRVAQVARAMAASGSPFAPKTISANAVAMKDIGGGVMRLAPTGEGTFEANPWLIPILNGQIRLQKPPLPYWCAAICFQLFGVSPFSARLIPALLGAIATLLIFDLAKILYGRRIALFSALAWLSTYFIIDEFRKAMADPYLAFFVLLASWSLISSRRARNCRSHARKCVGALILRTLIFYVALGLGFLAKGPLVVLWIAIVIASYVITTRFGLRNSQAISHGRDARVTWRILAHLVGVLLAIGIGGSWYLYVYRHVPHALDLWKYESIGEIAGNPENVRPWWFYFPNVLLILLPWILAAIVGAVLALRGNRNRLFPLLWLIIAVILFSFIQQKKNAYLLPAAPAIAILIGQGIATIIVAARRRHAWSGVVAAAQSCIGIGFCGALLVLMHNAIPMLPLVLCVIPLVLILRDRPRQWAITQPFAYIAALLIFSNLYITAKENERSSKTFMQQARQIVIENNGYLNVPAMPEDASFYLPLDFAGNRASNKIFAVIDDRRDEIHETSPQLAGFAEGKKIDSIKQVLATKRWKLFEITTSK